MLEPAFGAVLGNGIERSLLTADSSVLHVSATEATDSFLLLAVGVVSAQRIEWLIRARRMLAEARSV